MVKIFVKNKFDIGDLIVIILVLGLIAGGTIFFGERIKCSIDSGFWVNSNSPGGDYCQFETTDFGQGCDDINQCEGICLAESPGADEPGTCSEFVLTLGCNDILIDGGVETLCID